MYPDERISFLSKQSCSNYYRLLRDLNDHTCCLALGAGASATVGLPTWSLLLKRIVHCYFEQWTMKISSGKQSADRPPSDVSIALTNSYDNYLLKKQYPELLDLENALYSAEYWINGHKLSEEAAARNNQEMKNSDLLVERLQDGFMEKILSCDLTVTAQMIRNHVRSKDWNYLIRKSLYSSYKDNPYVLNVSPLYDALIRLLQKYKIANVINYNYDDTFYHAMVKSGIYYKNCYDGIGKQGPPCIFYPHGYIPMKGGVITDIVLSDDDYQQQIYHQNYWANNIQLSSFVSNTCIFVGLSLNDPNIRRIINTGPRSRPFYHYAFLPASGTDQANIMYDSLFDADLFRLGIRVIRYPYDANYLKLPQIINLLCEDDV